MVVRAGAAAGGVRPAAADGDDPVLILDDVFAELDAGAAHRLADLVAGAEQVLVTAAVAADVPAALAGARFDVADGEVSRDAVTSRRTTAEPDGARDPSPDDGLDWRGASTRRATAAADAGAAGAGRRTRRRRRGRGWPARTPTTATRSRWEPRRPAGRRAAAGSRRCRVRGVFARWPEIVGDEVAEHCTPESFDEGD